MKKVRFMSQVSALALAIALSASMLVSTASAASPFKDVPEGMWCYDAVTAAVNDGYMYGYGDGIFGPNDEVTRTQLAQVLFNKYGTDIGTETGFIDVPATHWGAKAVTWAVKNGLVSGYGNGYFGVNDTLTREQMATVLYNSAKAEGADVTQGGNANLDKYIDAGMITSYAVTPIKWAVGNNVISGTSDTTLSPTSTATRAQIAAIMLNYAKAVVDNNSSHGTGSTDSNGSGGNPGTPPSEPTEPTTPEIPSEPEYIISADVLDILDTMDPKSSMLVEFEGKKYGLTYTTTSPDSVNEANNVGKQYETFGYTENANQNGYHTNCTLDIADAYLDYDALELLNKYRNDQEYPRGDATWVVCDTSEEYAMVLAKYDTGEVIPTGAMVTRANSAKAAIADWQASGHLGRIASKSVPYLCMAYCDRPDGRYYALVYDKINSPTTPFSLADKNYELSA